LEDHRVYFETVAATLLSIMAIVVSWQQTALTRSQIQREERAERIQRTADWSELRNAIWAIFDHCPEDVVAGVSTMSDTERREWFLKLRKLLDSQNRNPVLISDREALGYWRNAISGAIVADDSRLGKDDDFAGRKAASIFRDVSKVWEWLVLDSDEVSATGGRPEVKAPRRK
jgi:predicted secreted protein